MKKRLGAQKYCMRPGGRLLCDLRSLQVIPAAGSVPLSASCAEDYAMYTGKNSMLN